MRIEFKFYMVFFILFLLAFVVLYYRLTDPARYFSFWWQDYFRVESLYDQIRLGIMTALLSQIVLLLFNFYKIFKTLSILLILAFAIDLYFLATRYIIIGERNTLFLASFLGLYIGVTFLALKSLQTRQTNMLTF